MSKKALYSLELLRTDNESKIKIVKNDIDDKKKLTLVVRINSYYNKTDNGFKASAELFEGENLISDVKKIIKSKGFQELVEYYHKLVTDLPQKEVEGESLLNDDKTALEPIGTINGTRFFGEVMRGIISKSRSKMNVTLESNFLGTIGTIGQGFNTYTVLENYNHEQMIVARTSTGIGAFPNLTMFHSNLTTPVFYLHLANVLLTNRLLLRQTNEVISGIEKVVLYIRRRAIPYSLIVTATNIIAAKLYYTGSASDAVDFGRSFYLFVLPFIWPIAAFIMRTYAPKIFPMIVRYAIRRILQT